jgi:hypothetical protein
VAPVAERLPWVQTLEPPKRLKVGNDVDSPHAEDAQPDQFLFVTDFSQTYSLRKCMSVFFFERPGHS